MLEGLSNGENGFSSSVKFLELVTTPRLGLGSVVTKVGDGSLGVVAFLDGTLVSSVDVVVEGVFEGDGVVLLSSLNFDNKGSDDGFVGSPGVRDESGGVEESWSDNIGLEIFFDSSLFHGPSDNLKVAVSIISDF